MSAADMGGNPHLDTCLKLCFKENLEFPPVPLRFQNDLGMLVHTFTQQMHREHVFVLVCAAWENPDQLTGQPRAALVSSETKGTRSSREDAFWVPFPGKQMITIITVIATSC